MNDVNLHLQEIIVDDFQPAYENGNLKVASGLKGGIKFVYHNEWCSTYTFSLYDIDIRDFTPFFKRVREHVFLIKEIRQYFSMKEKRVVEDLLRAKLIEFKRRLSKYEEVEEVEAQPCK